MSSEFEFFETVVNMICTYTVVLTLVLNVKRRWYIALCLDFHRCAHTWNASRSLTANRGYLPIRHKRRELQHGIGIDLALELP